jgi:hypothetical protein
MAFVELFVICALEPAKKGQHGRMLLLMIWSETSLKNGLLHLKGTNCHFIFLIYVKQYGGTERKGKEIQRQEVIL